MMPGPHGGHGPPAGPMHPQQHQPQGRRQEHYYHMPPQTHSPIHHNHNPYAQYHHPQHYVPQYGYPQHMQQMPQWNAYHQPPPPPPQYAMPPRQFQPHASPVVVSSHPHMPAMAPVNRALGQTPPIVHSRTPPVQRIQTPQPAPSSPSAHSQTHLSSSTPPTNTTADSPPAAAEKPAQAAPPSPTTRMPFYPPLPWLSVPGPFPARAAGRKRRRRAPVDAEEEGLALPSREQAVEDPTQEPAEVEDGERTPTEEPEESLASTVAVPSDAEVDTPSTSHPPSEVDLTHVPTPSAMPPPAQPSANAPKHTRNATIPAVPLIPFKPKPSSAASTTQKSAKSPPPVKAEDGAAPAEELAAGAEDTPKTSPPKPAAPKSWAELLRSKNAPATAAAQAPATPTSNGVVATNGPVVPRSNTLADVLASFSVDSEKKFSFLEPRGLVNTGNLCYMNSVSLECQNIVTPLMSADSSSACILRSFL
jgi:ubiquitin carboxyl-terminal hydrolase 10